MARDISELGADVIDDTIVVDKHKMSPKKRNYIIGLSITGVLLAGAIAGTVIACNTVLLDYANASNVLYYFTPRTSLEEGEEPYAVLYKLQSDVKYSSTFQVPSHIKGYKVIGIAESAFAGHTEIKHVVLPNTIEFIGEKAFENCENLGKFTWSKNLNDVGVGAFDNTKFYNELLTKTDVLYDLPSGLLIYVGEDYFQDGIALVSDELPESEYSKIKDKYHSTSVEKFSKYNIYNIASGAFRGNDRITYIDLPKALTEISNSTFEDCTSLKGLDASHSGLTSIKKSAFAGCKNLSYINLKDDIEEVGDNAFSNCGLVDSIPDLSSVHTLGSYIFSDCKNLTSITYSHNEVADYMFAGCKSLTTIEWGVDDSLINTVTKIGAGAFMQTGFTEFTVPMNVMALNDDLFKGSDSLETVFLYGNPEEKIFEEEEITDTFIDKNGEEKPGLLIGVSSIKASAFESCTSLDTIGLYDDDYLPIAGKYEKGSMFLPNSLQRTDVNTTMAGNNNNVFRYTVGTSVEINANVRALGSYVFADNKSLENVTFVHPEVSRLETVKNNAFSNCEKLKAVVLPASVTTIGPSVFYGCKEATTLDIGSTKITSLPAELFYDCEALETISIPETVQSIKSKTFYKNYKLNYAILPNSVREITEKAFTEMRKDTEDKFPVFLSWSKNTTGKNISTKWKDDTVEAYYLLADGETPDFENYKYWRYDESHNPVIVTE